jgi:hypothetical protein
MWDPKHFSTLWPPRPVTRIVLPYIQAVSEWLGQTLDTNSTY